MSQILINFDIILHDLLILSFYFIMLVIMFWLFTGWGPFLWFYVEYKPNPVHLRFSKFILYLWILTWILIIFFEGILLLFYRNWIEMIP